MSFGLQAAGVQGTPYLTNVLFSLYQLQGFMASKFAPSLICPPDSPIASTKHAGKWDDSPLFTHGPCRRALNHGCAYFSTCSEFAGLIRAAALQQHGTTSAHSGSSIPRKSPHRDTARCTRHPPLHISSNARLSEDNRGNPLRRTQHQCRRRTKSRKRMTVRRCERS